MMKLKETIKLIFFKKKYLSILEDEYGNPEDVSVHLQKISKKNFFFRRYLKKDIEMYDEENLRWIENTLERKQKFQEEEEKQRLYNGGCVECPYGNGEGGCTIPSCYKEKAEDEY